MPPTNIPARLRPPASLLVHLKLRNFRILSSHRSWHPQSPPPERSGFQCRLCFYISQEFFHSPTSVPGFGQMLPCGTFIHGILHNEPLTFRLSVSAFSKYFLLSDHTSSSGYFFVFPVFFRLFSVCRAIPLRKTFTAVFCLSGISNPHDIQRNKVPSFLPSSPH